MTIVAAADGSSLGNPGPAGWAWVIDADNWAAGGWPSGTNNKGELTAVLDLLQKTAHVTEPLHVVCDSQYVINSITKWMPGWKRKGWKKADGKPVQNVELMQQLDRAMSGRKVTFEWVRGHAGHELNEQADQLARAAATAFASKQPPQVGPGFTIVPADTVTAPVEPADDGADALFDLPEPTTVDTETLVRALLGGASTVRLRQLIAPSAVLIDVDGTAYTRRTAVSAAGKKLFAGALARAQSADITVQRISDSTEVAVVRAEHVVASMVWQRVAGSSDAQLISHHESALH